MKKEVAALAMGIALVAGFVAGSTTAILEREKGVEGGSMALRSPSPMAIPPLSVEDLEKIEDLKEDLRNKPDDSSSCKRLGNLYSRTGQTRGAFEAYEQYLKLEPEDAEVRTDVGLLLRSLGDFDAAVEAFRKAMTADPKHGRSRYYLGLVLLQDKRDIQGATRAWEDFLKVSPGGELSRQVKVQLERLKETKP